VPDIDIYALGARPNVPDIFVEVDYMDTPESKPNPDAIRDVIQLFLSRGIALHVDLGTAAPGTELDMGEGNVVPTVEYIDYSDSRPGGTASGFSFANFYTVKAANFPPSRKGAFHYLIYGIAVEAFPEVLTQAIGPGAAEVLVDKPTPFFYPHGAQVGIGEVAGDHFTYTGISFNPPRYTGVSGIDLLHAKGDRVSALRSTSGRSPIFDNDIMVAKALWNSFTGQTRFQEAGTFMHELGHSLGLRHGGADNVNYKPNYLSIMNYLFQTNGLPTFSSFTPCTVATSRIDYSGSLLRHLVETSLSEAVGIRDGADDTEFRCPNASLTCGDGNQGINWNCDTKIEGICTNCDVNGVGGFETLLGNDDWTMKRLDFRHSPGYASGADQLMQLPPEDELDFETAIHLRPATNVVAVDVRPGTPQNPVNIRSRGPLPVAILSSPGFDAPASIVPGTVTFGRRGTEAPATSCATKDVDGDGDNDVLCQFSIQNSRLDTNTLVGQLRALTTDGRELAGGDRVKVVP
jgi:hypothetical protein